MELNKIICGDALYELRNLPNESVDMVMTSPPYYGLRDYGGIEGQLGLEKTVDEYLEKLLLITGEIKRVLKKEGSVFWNHGDSYNVAKIGNTNASTGKIGKPRYSGENLNNKKKLQKGMPPKCLMGQPWRLALAMIDKQGWILRSDIKWIKQILIWKEKRTIGSIMPTSVNDRYNSSGEYIFHFVKSPKYYFDLSTLKVKAQESGKESPRTGEDGTKISFNIRKQVETGERKRPPAFMASPQEFNKEWQEKKKEMYGNDDKGSRRSRVRAFLNTKGKYSKEFPNAQPNGRAHFNTGKALHDYYKEKGIEEKFIYKKNIPNAWLIGTEPSKEKHFAQYPKRLCEIPILTACPEKGIVLDPFMGSGTTALAAKLLGRNYIGIEKNPEYVKIAEERIKAISNPLF